MSKLFLCCDSCKAGHLCMCVTLIKINILFYFILINATSFSRIAMIATVLKASDWLGGQLSSVLMQSDSCEALCMEYHVCTSNTFTSLVCGSPQ